MKIQLILLLYDMLLGGKKVVRKEFCARNNVSERTFYRYIKEVALFLMHNKPGMLLGVAEPHGEYFIEQKPNE